MSLYKFLIDMNAIVVLLLIWQYDGDIFSSWISCHLVCPTLGFPDTVFTQLLVSKCLVDLLMFVNMIIHLVPLQGLSEETLWERCLAFT